MAEKEQLAEVHKHWKPWSLDGPPSYGTQMTGEPNQDTMSVTRYIESEILDLCGVSSVEVDVVKRPIPIHAQVRLKVDSDSTRSALYELDRALNNELGGRFDVYLRVLPPEE